MTRVYVGNIDRSVTKAELLDFLRPMESAIEDTWLARSPPGFAFLTVTPSQVSRFVQSFNGREFRGKKLVVEESKTKHRQGPSRRRERSEVGRRRRDRRREDSRSDRHGGRRRGRSRSSSSSPRRDRSRERKRHRRSYSSSSSRSSRSS